MSAPAAKAFSFAGEDDAADRLVVVEVLERPDELAHQLVRERVQLLGPVEADDRDRLISLEEDRSFLLQELLDRLLRLLGRHREREPVARVVDRLVPGEVAPEVEVLLRVARRLRELAREALDEAVDLGVELRARARRG